MDAALVIEALNRGLDHLKVEADQRLMHIDQGSQYLANVYRELLHKNKIACSMSSEGCWWDNAVEESFFSTLKMELNLDDVRDDLISLQRLQRDLVFWIDGSFNRERRHSTICYLSPIDYGQASIATRKLTRVNP
jgi:putative transposase